MTRTRPRSLGWAAATVALAATACGDAAPPVPSRVVVTPASASAETVGTTVQFSAQVQDAQGATIPGAEVAWSSARPEVATVSATGLATVAGPGTAVIRATHQAVSGTASLAVELRPADMRKVAGDSLSAAVLSILPEDPRVRVVDASGAPVPNAEVAFRVAAGGGEVSAGQARTNSDGEASTRWTLGEAPGVNRLHATSGDLQAEFVATATAELVVATSRLPRARIDVPYREALEAKHAQGPVEWSVSDGSLPRGLVLEAHGVVSGEAVEQGASAFTVSARDSAGARSSREVHLLVCGPALRMEPGTTASDGPVGPDGCPPFLPAGDAGSLYRVAVIRSNFSTSLTFVPVAVTVRKHGEMASDAGADAQAGERSSLDPTAAGESRQVPGKPHRSRPRVQLPPDLAEAVERADATSRLHERLLAQTRELYQRLGRDALLPDLGGRRAGPRAALAQQTAPPGRISIRPYDTGRASEVCQYPAPEPEPALLLGYNAHLAIYQDSVQHASEPVETAAAQQVLDYYDAYGAETIAEYFGGVSDVDDNGRVNVVVSPAVEDGVAAFVWSLDMTDQSDCPWSNEMELVYFHANMFHALSAPDGGYQALPTMVHEVKHVSSLYKRWQGGGFHPSWVEEGGAEIAAEVSSRKAIEATGGVAMGATFTRDSYPPRDGSIISPENYGVLLRLVRMSLSYAGGPNSLTTDPGDHHSFYGTSWHFHRFLGDAYGNAAEKAEARIFAELNASLTPAGTRGIEQVVGSRMAVLLEEYAAAMIFGGTGAPQPLRAFRTYDFRSATYDLFRRNSAARPDGLYPWPVTGASPSAFQDAVHEYELAPAGIAFFDFESDGSGHGIEVEVVVGGPGAFRVLVARIR